MLPTNKIRGRRAFSLVELIIVITILAVIAAIAIPQLGNRMTKAKITAARTQLQTVRSALVGSPDAPGLADDLRYVCGGRLSLLSLANLLVHTNLLDGSSMPAFDPASGQGWRGPYLTVTSSVQNNLPEREGLFPEADDQRFERDSTFKERGFFRQPGDPEGTTDTSPYGEPGDPTIGDPWGNPLVLQVPSSTAEPTITRTRSWRYARLVSAGPDGILQTPRDRLAGRNSAGVEARGDDIVLFLNRADIYEEATP